MLTEREPVLLVVVARYVISPDAGSGVLTCGSGGPGDAAVRGLMLSWWLELDWTRGEGVNPPGAYPLRLCGGRHWCGVGR